jgi:hypothetical protein
MGDGHVAVRLKLEYVVCHVAIHVTAASPLIGAHCDFIHSALRLLRDSRDDSTPDRALGSASEQHRPPVPAV